MTTATVERPGTRKAGEEQRRQRLRELRQELLAYFPGPVPRSRLVLMDVDPATLHAYWSIDPDYIAGLRRRHRTPAAPLVLRLHAVNGHDPDRCLDFELEGFTNNRYVSLWGEGRTFLGQIGLRTKRRFISVATSAPVRMPEMAPPPQARPEVAAPQPEPARLPEEVERVAQLETEREDLIRGRYRELTSRAAAGGHEGLEASPPVATPVFGREEAPVPGSPPRGGTGAGSRRAGSPGAWPAGPAGLPDKERAVPRGLSSLALAGWPGGRK